jgi:glucose/arabinose dehydrogenase
MSVALGAPARVGLLAISLVLAIVFPAAAGAATLPSGFQETTVPFEGLEPGQGIEEPTAFRFAPDGKVFVAEKSGKILVYDSLADHTPTLFADLRTEVYNANDRGLLGLALDPQFSAAHPYVYVLYAYDAPPGEEAPYWGNPGEDGDPCPEPPGSETDGCVIQGRLSRLTADLATDKSIAEKPMITDWCQQFSSHSIGDLQFDAEGNLWASGGEGASFTKVDWGQYGYPEVNPCADPPSNVVGGIEEPPNSEGGALRSQNPQKLGGKLIRINPETGEGVPANPLHASLNANERRIVGMGFRNPFRFAIDPVTGEIYVDNVGSSIYEEMDRLSPSSSQVYNSGWPCYEGPEKRELYEFRGLKVCEHLYENPGLTSQPLFYYSHESGVTPEDHCPYEPGSVIGGLAFYEGGTYPPGYDGALFFADPVRGCIYVMRAGEDGRPNPSKVEPFLTEGGLYPGVDMEVGPEGDIYYLNLYGAEYGPGAIHHIHYDPNAPQAKLKADHTSGALPLTVHFDAGESTGPSGQALEYEWDLDGNGVFGPPTSASTATEIYKTAVNRTASVRVVDEGHASVAQLTVYPGDTPPQVDIEEPSDGARWHVGQAIDFAGSATEDGGSPLPTARLYWRSRLYHCPGGPESCHAHPLQVFPARESGTLIAPDHDLPSHIELSLTATDARGLSSTATVNLYPNVSFLGIESKPPGIVLSAGLQTEATPFGVEAIEGSGVTLTAPATAEVGGKTYVWQKWSDGGGRVHSVDAQPGSTNYTAEYALEEEIEEEAEEETPPVVGPPATVVPPPLVQGALPSPAPTVTLRDHPPKVTHSNKARFVFRSTARGASFKCKLDKGAFNACRSPENYMKLTVGSHRFAVVAITSAGWSVPARFSWKVLPKRR